MFKFEIKEILLLENDTKDVHESFGHKTCWNYEVWYKDKNDVVLLYRS